MIIKYLRYLFNKKFPLKISDFSHTITNIEYYKSIYNKRITYFDKSNIEIGYIEYNLHSGKICLFFITEEKYRNRGLGEQILQKVINNMKQYGTNRAWLVTANCPHKFWEKNGFTYANPPDCSVTMHGYTRII